MSWRCKRVSEIEDLAGGGRSRRRSDPILPMINIVYLLLTFFLILGALRFGDSMNILSRGAGSQSAARDGAVTLHVEADGAVRFQGRTMPVAEAVIAIRSALAAMPRGSLDVRADHKMPASAILPLLRKLREGGIASIRVVPVRRAGPA
jgi:biopolymer transport protein ExbD